MAGVAVEIDYAVKGDLLWFGNGIPNTDSAQNVTYEPDFDAFFSVDGKCAGAYLFDAAHILLPQLMLDSQAVNFTFKELSGAYCRDADTLIIGNERMAAPLDELRSEKMAEGLTAHYGETGGVVGFTLERAAELLLPHLGIWRPLTEEEMAQVRKDMDDILSRIQVPASFDS